MGKNKKHTRLKLDEEDYEIIKSEQFHKIIQDVRKRLNIPELEAEKDTSFREVTIDNRTRMIDVSLYIESLSKKQEEKFSNEALGIIERNGFSAVFRNGIEYYMLYNKIPQMPTWEYLPYLFEGTKNMNNIHAFLAEDQTRAKKMFRLIHDIEPKGKIPSEFMPEYKDLLKSFNLRKSKRRTKKTPIAQDFTINKRIESGEKYKDIADEILDPNEEMIFSKETIKRKSKALKQRDYRLKKRLS